MFNLFFGAKFTDWKKGERKNCKYKDSNFVTSGITYNGFIVFTNLGSN